MEPFVMVHLGHIPRHKPISLLTQGLYAALYGIYL